MLEGCSHIRIVKLFCQDCDCVNYRLHTSCCCPAIVTWAMSKVPGSIVFGFTYCNSELYVVY